MKRQAFISVCHRSSPGVHEGTPAGNVSMEGDLSLSERPVMMSGEAGPPGTKLSLLAPQGTNGSMTPVTGYAGAPGTFGCADSTENSFRPNAHYFSLSLTGYPEFPAGVLNPDSVSGIFIFK